MKDRLLQLLQPFLPPLQHFYQLLLERSAPWIAKLPPFPHRDKLLPTLLALSGVILLYLVVRTVHRLLFGTVQLIFQDPNVRGDKLFAKGKFEKARRAFIKSKNYLKIAQCCLKLGEYKEAAKYFEAAKEFDLAGRYFAQEGEFLRAARIFESCGRYLDAGEKFELAGEFMAAGEIFKRLHHLKKAEEMFSRIHAHHRIADMYLEEYKHERKKLKDKPDPKLLDKRHAYLLELAKKAGDAFCRSENYGSAADIYVEGRFIAEAAGAYEQAGQFLKAAQLFSQANLMAEAAQNFEKAGSFQDALDLYRQANELEGVARILDTTGRCQEAAEVRAMLELNRGKKIEAATRYVQANKLSEAAELYKEIKNYPQAIELYLKMHNYSAAAEVYLLLEDLEHAAECYLKANRFSAAAKCYLKLNQEDKYLDTLNRGGAFLEAGLYLDSKQDERAIAVLQQIASDSPDFRYACNLLGRIFLRKGMDSLANEKLERAVHELTMDKNNIDLFYDLAQLRNRQQRGGEALKLFDGILAVDYHYKDALTLKQETEKALNDSARTQTETSQIRTRTSGNLTGEFTVAKEGERIINQRYHVKREIGRGGMGVVFQAWDETLQRSVALKFLPMSLTPNDKELQKFLNEARSAARLNHPHIVTIYDIDRDQEGGSYFIVMEYVDGINLKEAIEASQNLPIGVIQLICQQICDGLGYAHQHNIIHRDIKSANIIWTNDKIVKITDFGLAKMVEESLIGSTKALGSPVYMSPEQVLGLAVDARSDIYSFGVSIYEMVTGHVPFDRGDIGYHHVNTKPRDVAEHRQETPAYLCAIIGKCIEKQPKDRFQSTSEIKTAFSSERVLERQQ